MKSKWANRLQAAVGDNVVDKVWAKFMQDHKVTKLGIKNCHNSV